MGRTGAIEGWLILLKNILNIYYDTKYLQLLLASKSYLILSVEQQSFPKWYKRTTWQFAQTQPSFTTWKTVKQKNEPFYSESFYVL